MDWKLIEVTEDRECTLDDSGVYAVINRAKDGKIRVDIMTSNDEPLQSDMPLISFIGEGNAVRKTVANWIADTDIDLGGMLLVGTISTEHASYIGYEIARAMANENYKQD